MIKNRILIKDHHKELISSPDIQIVWLKAAVVAGLWASFEIIIGSLLHNIYLPFAGSILTAFAVCLLVAFSQLWKDKGLIWRAGLICALMKSVSPSAIILGPMTAIMLEGFLFNFSLSLFGYNWFGYLTGGALCLLSALLHKIINLLILYGFNIIDIYINLFQFVTKQINMVNASFWMLLIVLSIVYALIGVFAASIGIVIGRKAQKLSSSIDIMTDLAQSKTGLFHVNQNEKFSLALLFSHLLIIPVCLYLLGNQSIYISIPVILIYIIVCLVYYQNSLRKLKKTTFWIQLFVITILAAFFWNGFSKSGNWFDINGLWVGVMMNIRALIVIIGFAAFSVELRNPLIRLFLFNKGFRQLYLSVSIAFEALPLMIASMDNSLVFFRNPLKSISRTMLQAENWLIYFQNQK